MNLIFSADPDWGIGKDGKLLYHVPGDMAFFRGKTTGGVVVMGRKTLATLPGGKPLRERTNVVLTRDRSFRAEDAVVRDSLGELFIYLDRFRDEEIYIIGGAEVYRQLLPYCATAYVTRWDTAAEADSFVPDLDKDPAWQLAERSEEQREQGVAYRFCTYVQDSPRAWRT